MAVFREPPKCPFCGKVVAKAIYNDYGGIPIIQRPFGDAFIRWEYEEHNCKLMDSAEFKIEKIKCTCECHNSGGMMIHCVPCCKDGFIEISRL